MAVKGAIIMKQMKRIFCVFMMIVFVLTFVSPTSIADAYTKSITEGEWTNAHSENDYYKVVVGGEGYITLTSKSDDGVAYYEILNSKKHEFSDHTYVDGGYDGNRTIKVAVSKGTYYIHYFGDESNDTACVKYTFTSIKQPTNYCKGKAITLKAGTKKKIYQTPKYGFNRYFKIKLGTKRRISVYSESNIFIFNSKGKDLDTDTSFTDDGNVLKYRTTKKLPAGTYYIVSMVGSPGKSAINTVRWQ